MKQVWVPDYIFEKLENLSNYDRANVLNLAIGNYDLYKKMTNVIRRELRTPSTESERVWKVRRVDDINEPVPETPGDLIDFLH